MCTNIPMYTFLQDGVSNLAMRTAVAGMWWLKWTTLTNHCFHYSEIQNFYAKQILKPPRLWRPVPIILICFFSSLFPVIGFFFILLSFFSCTSFFHIYVFFLIFIKKDSFWYLMVTWLRYAQFSCIFRKPFVRSGNHNTHIFLLQLSSGENLHSFCCLGFMFLLFSTVSFRDCHFVRQINFELLL